MNGGYTFPGNSVLGPDVSFMTFDRIDKAASETRRYTEFYRAVPQFVIEVPASDTAIEGSYVEEKMEKNKNIKKKKDVGKEKKNDKKKKKEKLNMNFSEREE